MENRDESVSVRINVRIPTKTYELMRKMGSVLGIETDGGCVKHFLMVGLQASAGGISSIATVDTQAQSLNEIKTMNKSLQQIEQMDLVKEASKKAS